MRCRREACLEQECRLRHDAHSRAQARQPDIADVHAVDEDLASLDLCQPQEGSHNAALPGTCKQGAAHSLQLILQALLLRLEGSGWVH